MFSCYLLFIYRRIVKCTVKNGLLSARPPTPNRFFEQKLIGEGEKRRKIRKKRTPPLAKREVWLYNENGKTRESIVKIGRNSHCRYSRNAVFFGSGQFLGN